MFNILRVAEDLASIGNMTLLFIKESRHQGSDRNRIGEPAVTDLAELVIKRGKLPNLGMELCVRTTPRSDASESLKESPLVTAEAFHADSKVVRIHPNCQYIV